MSKSRRCPRPSARPARRGAPTSTIHFKQDDHGDDPIGIGPVRGGHAGHTYRFTRRRDGTTEIDYVVVREGKNLKRRFLGVVLGTVGKRVLAKAFVNSVKAIEARNAAAAAEHA
jgi:hypothetical protein